MIRKTTKGPGANYRPTKSGAGMTAKGVKAYRAANPGSKLKTAVQVKLKKVLKMPNVESLIVQDHQVNLKDLLLKQETILILELDKLGEDGNVR